MGVEVVGVVTVTIGEVGEEVVRETVRLAVGERVVSAQVDVCGYNRVMPG